MIPRLPLQDSLNSTVADFLETLKTTAFSGEIRGDLASRLLSATDNSIYQILPQAVIFPKNSEDVVQIFRLANQETFKTLTFSPRGGGTGTNGQSLSPGIIIDCSKYMNRILEVNLEQGWVRVQTGVILDQLNAYLKPDGVFFAPSLSPSDRATLGGMINTDAAGKGSRIYGRTSDHLLELTWVLSDGMLATSTQVNQNNLNYLQQKPGREGKIYRQVNEIISQKQELIEATFPKITRFMTGYNLAKVYSSQGQTFDLNRILAGSEGTLAVITEAKLKLTKIPRYKQLLIIHYPGFDEALKDAENLLTYNPSAIETIDEKILKLAQQDAIYPEVKDFIREAKAINLVEFIGDSASQIQQVIVPLLNTLESSKFYLTKDERESAKLWELRKKVVGLLGNTAGNRKPIAFVEDTAVPPACLANYIQEFKALLSAYQLDYAMFGHVDVGCVHVRPALDLKLPQDEALIRELSDKVVALVRKYGGVMWGEHGKGFRSEYTPVFFGEELYEDLRKIKAAFDPHNKLNPGKIVTPYQDSAQIVQLKAPLRGHFDRQVKAELRSQYEDAFNCNGNGACFNFDPDSVMCPSAKETRNRIHSPKGRATLMREWLRQISLTNPSNLKQSSSFPAQLWHILAKFWGVTDYSHQVYEAMHGCLSCKACASQCPIHVNIPDMKAQFLALYHTRYPRPLRDYLIGQIETLAQLQSSAPNFINKMIEFPMTKWLIKKGVGIVDPPLGSFYSLSRGLRERNAPIFNLEKLSNLSQTQRENSVILIQDAFTSFYEAQLVLDTYDFFKKLGYTVYIAPFFVNGKSLHVKGFLRKFHHLAQKNSNYLQELAKLEIPLLGIEPSITLTYRDEYCKILGIKPPTANIQLLQEFLVMQSDRLPIIAASKPYYLLGHCTEKTTALDSQKQWQKVFRLMGLNLNLVSVGCCGMAGIYGHESEHYAYSKGIYESSWKVHLPDSPDEHRYYLATGFSCRSQVQRFSQWSPLHPIQALLETYE